MALERMNAIDNGIAETQDNRMEWIEPTIMQLDVRDTANSQPKRANDYNYQTQYPDCTLS